MIRRHVVVFKKNSLNLHICDVKTLLLTASITKLDSVTKQRSVTVSVMGVTKLDVMLNPV